MNLTNLEQQPCVNELKREQMEHFIGGVVKWEPPQPLLPPKPKPEPEPEPQPPPLPKPPPVPIPGKPVKGRRPLPPGWQPPPFFFA
jgi:hypothetical protein